MLKKIFLVSLIFFIAAVSWHFGYKKMQERKHADQLVQDNGKINVAVTIYPLAYFVEKVGGDLVNVHVITPGGVEPHEYEPTPVDIITVESSRALVFNGGGIDAWADRLAPELGAKGIQVLKMFNHLNLDPKVANDPHIWLNIGLVQKQVQNIVQLLEVLDPSHKDIFEQNAVAFTQSLSELDSAYRSGLSHCDTKDIVSSHDAFGYLGSRYGFAVHSIAGISPEEEPSAAHLAELGRLIHDKKIRTVFFESLISPKLSETLAREVGAESAVLDPIEGLTEQAASQGKNYDILMRENLASLQKAMVCR